MDDESLKIDGFDDAIIGMAHIWRDQQTVTVFVYRGATMVEILMRDGLSRDEAVEYIDFNIEGAYVGLWTPVIVWDIEQ